MSNSEQSAIRASVAVSAAADPSISADLVADELARSLESDASLLLVASTAEIKSDFESQCKKLTDAAQSRITIGITASGVIGRDIELESAPALSAIALKLDRAEVLPIEGEDILGALGSPHKLAAQLHADNTQRGMLVLADPFSVPIDRVVEQIERARETAGVDPASSPLIGCASSLGHAPGENTLLLNGKPAKSGLVGCAFRGDLAIDAAVVQSCRPVGPLLTVTRCRRGVILEIDGEPATTRLDEAIDNLDESDAKLVRRDMLVGIQDPNFERAPLSIRSIIAFRRETRDIAIAAEPQAGSTMRLAVLDPSRAAADLGLALDAQRLRGGTRVALAFSTGARGSKLFGKPGHDARLITRGFAGASPGEQAAKPGETITPGAHGLPLWGMRSPNQIGRLSRGARLLSETASLAFLRDHVD